MVDEAKKEDAPPQAQTATGGVEEAIDGLRASVVKQRQTKAELNAKLAEQQKLKDEIVELDKTLAAAISDTQAKREAFEAACDQEGLAGHVDDGPKEDEDALASAADVNLNGG